MYGIAQKAKVQHHDFSGGARTVKKNFRLVARHFKQPRATSGGFKLEPPLHQTGFLAVFNRKRGSDSCQFRPVQSKILLQPDIFS
jgi:hypothetical protein